MQTIRTTEYSLPAPVSGLRLAILADLHDRDARGVAAAVSRLSPDACLFVGDLFESPPRRRRPAYDEAALCLELLAPLCPLFWVPGNHDATTPPPLDAQMSRLGVHRMDNRFEPFRGIVIGGLSSAQYLTEGTPDTAFLDRFSRERGYKLLLCHHPEYYPAYVRNLPIDLMVAGHAHGGQWSLCGHGLYAPGQGLFPRYTAGLYEGRLLVSRGLKPARLIPRIANPREIVLLTLGEI